MKRFLLCLSAGTLLLALPLYAGVFSITEGFALPVQLTPLALICALSALLCAALYTIPQALPRRLTAAGVLVCLGLLIWRYFAPLLAGAQLLFHRISYAFYEAIPSILYYELPQDLAHAGNLRQEELITPVFLLAVPMLALWLGFWLLRKRVCWPAVLPVLALPGLGLFILLTPPAPCTALLLLWLGLLLITRRSWRQDPLLGAKRTWAALVPLSLLLSLLVIAVPQEHYVRDSRVENLRQRILTLNFPVRAPGLSPFSPAAPAGVQDLSQAGPLHFDGHTVLTLRSPTASGRVLLKGFSGAVYTGGSWAPLEESDYDRLGDFPAWNLPAQALSASGGIQTLSIQDVDAQGSYFYLPYFPADLPGDPSLYLDGALIRPSQERTYTVSFLSQGTALSGSVQDAAYRDWVFAHYLDVPEDLLTQQALARIDGFIRTYDPQSTSTAQEDLWERDIRAARAVATWLSTFTRYDQNTPQTPRGADFVSHFLTDSHRGYCLHYASAATLVLRRMGIPARFIGGYTAHMTPNITVQVPDENAHAWVEIYLEGFGWYPVDVTPGFFEELATPTPSPTPFHTPSPTPSRTPAPPSPSYSPTPSAPISTPGRTPSGTQNTPSAPSIPWGRILPPILLISVSFSLFFLQYFLRIAHKRKLSAHADPNRAVLALYRHLRTLSRHIGTEMPQKAEQLAQKALFSQHTLTPEEYAAMQQLLQTAVTQAKTASLWKRFLLKYIWALI